MDKGTDEPWARRTMKLRRRQWSGLFLATLVSASADAPVYAKLSYLEAFRSEYPAAAGSRIDTCSLCHSAVPQRNSYGDAYDSANRQFASIEGLDSDGDGVPNLAEIEALTFPGDSADVPVLASPTPTATVPPATATATPTGTVPLVTSTPTATRTPGTGPCAGDCNDNGVVTVDELVRAVRIALETANVDVCNPADRDGNHAVSINELVLAVNAALHGCT